MPLADAFWKRLREQNLLDEAQLQAAHQRLAEVGGAPDSAVLETRPMGAADRARLLHLAADELGLRAASIDDLAKPDPRALASLPSELCALVPMLPLRSEGGALIVAAPANAEASVTAAAESQGMHLVHHLALEIAVREGLDTHLKVALPERFAPLRLPSPRTRLSSRATPTPLSFASKDVANG